MVSKRLENKKYRVDKNVYPIMVAMSVVTMIAMNIISNLGYPFAAVQLGWGYFAWGGIMILFAVKDENINEFLYKRVKIS